MKELIDILKNVNDYIDWQNEKSIFSEGLIDSMELLEIITKIEETFNIEIGIDDITAENFDSIESILKLIEKEKQ